MSTPGTVVPNDSDEPVVFEAGDGWTLVGTLCLPDLEPPSSGVVLVHGSMHEQDAFVYGVGLPAVLAERGIASLRFDIRGRGSSRAPRPWQSLTPVERRAVTLDVTAGVDLLRSRTAHGVQIGVVGEQDTAASVVDAVCRDRGVAALVLLSPRLRRTSIANLAVRSVPTWVMVSKEDRLALRDAAGAYSVAPAPVSELHVESGLGFGTTMFMARAFEQPDEPTVEATLADWLSRVL